MRPPDDEDPEPTDGVAELRAGPGLAPDAGPDDEPDVDAGTDDMTTIDWRPAIERVGRSRRRVVQLRRRRR